MLLGLFNVFPQLTYRDIKHSYEWNKVDYLFKLSKKKMKINTLYLLGFADAKCVLDICEIRIAL